jgi:hypothetical protein
VSQDIFSNIKAEQRKGIKINENKISLVMKTPLGTVYSRKILAFPAPVQPGREFEVHTDASYSGLGAVLQPDKDGNLRPIFYASRALSQSEKNYSATALEALCVVWSLELFRPYLGDSHFKVLTDHHALVWLFGQAETTKQTVMMRWVLRLQAFDFEVKYRPGETNKVADALSRYPQLAQRYHLKGDIEPLYAIEAKEKSKSANEWWSKHNFRS